MGIVCQLTLSLTVMLRSTSCIERESCRNQCFNIRMLWSCRKEWTHGFNTNVSKLLLLECVYVITPIGNYSTLIIIRGICLRSVQQYATSHWWAWKANYKNFFQAKQTRDAKSRNLFVASGALQEESGIWSPSPKESDFFPTEWGSNDRLWISHQYHWLEMTARPCPTLATYSVLPTT
jgi:hypothetical protein